VFDVKGDRDVLVALSNLHGNPRVQTYLVVLGANSNSQIKIYRVGGLFLICHTFQVAAHDTTFYFISFCYLNINSHYKLSIRYMVVLVTFPLIYLAFWFKHSIHKWIWQGKNATSAITPIFGFFGRADIFSEIGADRFQLKVSHKGS
jgi:hypothetical protein